MNERIKEIHRQVMLWSDTPDCPDTAEWHPGQIPEEYTKKFAELIVRECADQCTTDGSFCAEVVWGKQFNKKILKHFGVEE